MWDRDRPATWRIWSSLGIAILLYVPWIPILLNQIAYISGWKPAGFSEGLFGLLFKILLPMYSFSLGETTMPWQPAGLLGATLVGLLWVVGALDLLQTKAWTSRFVLALCILPFAFIIAFSIVIIYAFPSRVLVAAPFFFLITAAGVGRIRSMRWQGVAVVGILIAYGITLGNYFAGRNFINPTYAVPTRGILTYIQTNQQATDVIISESDSGLDFYLEQENSPIPHFVDFDQARGYVLTAGSHRVWILSLGRDSTRSDETPDLIHWLEQQGFHLEQQRGYIETEPIYRNLKSRALGYPAYPYRAVLRLYVRS